MKTELETIQVFLEEPTPEDVNVVKERGNDLAVIIARTGHLMAETKRTLNDKLQSEVMDALRNIAKETPFATSRTVNALIDSLCREERYMYEWTERLNNTASKQLEWCRTIISLAKQEMYSTRNFNT